jgi:glycosyltransferase involved in cell wall biosynthesis
MRREGAAFELVYIHKYEPAARYVAMARSYMPRARRIYSVADLHGLRMMRQAQVEDRPELVAHAKFVSSVEMTAAASCHAVVTHSPVEAAMMRRVLPHANVEVVPWHVPIAATPQVFAERAGIAFIGSYAHAPNLDGALRLVDEIMPLVWQAAPETRCILAGSDMPRILSEPRDNRVQAIGQVASLSDLLGQTRLTVAPMAYGAGLKGKVLDSLARGVPCICSAIAAEGFDLPPPLRALVADDAAGLAAAIVRLHGDPALFAACREAGLAYVASAFSEAVVDSGLRRAAGLAEMPAMMAAAD